jgi:hypothetical protein
MLSETQVATEKEIPASITMLANAAADVNSAVAGLLEDLNPARCPVPESPPTEKGVDAVKKCGLARALDDIAVGLRRNTESIQRARNELQL